MNLKNNIRLSILILTLCLPFGVFANVTVYQHCDFQGFRATLPVGDYDLPDLQDRGILNDDLSAIRVPKGYEIIVYEHHRFSGRQLKFKHNVSCLVNNDFNDRISSIKVRKISGSEKVATVYEHCDFQGYRVELSVGDYDLNQLRQMGIKNDDLSSLSVKQGYEIIAYEHHHFAGRQLKSRRNVSCLVNDSFNDRISSIKVRKIPVSRNVATVYQHCDYEGYGVDLAVGSYDLNQLQRLGIKNDDLSSLQVNRGYEITLYEHHNFSGRRLTLRHNNYCLTNNSFNDIISSIRINRIP